MAPVIGITPQRYETRSEAFGDLPVHGVARGYVDGIERAGGVPLVLPFGELPEGLDGLLLTGGPDVDPGWYGEEPAGAEMDGVDRQRDHIEMDMVRDALRTGLPLFGICRGVQIMAVALGGSLHQHLGGQPHDTGPEAYSPRHLVEVEEHSRLARLAGSRTILVNSLHHQAVRRPPEGWTVTARDGSGIIESLEGDGATFALGVQWHPEILLEHPPHQALFDGLVAAASRHRD